MIIDIFMIVSGVWSFKEGGVRGNPTRKFTVTGTVYGLLRIRRHFIVENHKPKEFC